MKKFLLYFSISAVLLVVGSAVNAQSLVQTLFTEDFEVYPNSMLNVNQPNASAWDTTSRLASTGNYCDTNFAAGHSFSYLLSPVIDITGFVSVNVAFDQICYLEEFDDAYLEISFDGGFNWRRTGPSNYKGGSFLTPGDSAFSSFSRPVKWHFGLADSMWVPPSNTDAWITENFDISNMVAQFSGASDSIRLRFTLRDDPSSAFGRVGLHTWFLDNIIVTGAPCELIPPTINLADPFRYIEQYDDVVYFTGPYDFSAQFRDASLIDTAYLATIIKPQGGGTWIYDTIQFNVQSGSNYFAEIPAQTIGDTVCYKIVVTDASLCKNRTVYPANGQYVCFLVRDNLPPACQTKPIFDFPYVQTFNSADFAVGQSIALADNWLNGTGDFHNWWVGQDSTSTPFTGPIGDVSPTGGGKFLYVEATQKLGQTAILFSPCLDLYQIPNSSVKFYLNMRGFGGNMFHVDLYSDSAQGYIQDIIPAITGGAVDDWVDVEFNMYDYRNTITQLRFRGTPSPTSEFSDIALDSFKIVYSPLIDLRVESAYITPFNPENEQDEIMLTVRNLGALTINNATVFYEVLDDTGGVIIPAVQSNWTGNSRPNDLDTIFVNQKYTVPLGRYAIRAWVKAPNDERANNDTSSFVNSIGLAYRGLDFFDGFETDTIFQPIPFSSPFGNDWELGTPNGVWTNSAYSGTQSWDINLNGGYNGNGQIINLYTPFFNFTAADSMLLYFYNNREIETNSDGVTLYYSLDEGVTWDSLSGLHDPKRKFWYNSFLAGNLGGTPVFADTTKLKPGNDNGWVESEVLLPDTFNNAKYALFRFAFYAEQDEDGGDGMSIDNFRIVDPVPQNIQAVKISTPRTGCEVGDNLRDFRATIKNVGSRVINNVPIDIKVTFIDETGGSTVQTGFEVVNATIQPRDNFTFTTTNQFDFSAIGDYTIEIVTKLPGDPKVANDTMRRFVEHYEGCDVVLLFSTSDAITDSSRWRLESTMDGREYIFSKPFAGWVPQTFYSDKVCVKNGSRVKFQLGDRDSSVSFFSVVGYDTSYIDNLAGGPAAKDANFDWICPPQLSATPERFIFNQGKVEFPVAGDYDYEVVVQNDGLDSLDVVNLKVNLDNNIILDTTIVFDGNRYPNGLRFRRKRKIGTPPFTEFLDPGVHVFQAITSMPNNMPDDQPEDDTLEYRYTIIDTVKRNISLDGYSTDFEATADPKWMSLNSYTYAVENSWELGAPNKTNINAANSGTNAWITGIDSNYTDYDSSSLFSPFILFQKDSCYEFSFYHNYFIADFLHDGGHVQYSTDTGRTWITVDNRGLSSSRVNWYNTPHVASIPFNDQNAGWTGNSSGYIQSNNVIGFDQDLYGIIRFRFESDGFLRSEGWAIDDFNIQATNASECFVVGIEENLFDESKLQMGQNIPNPATNNTVIPYFLPNSGNVDFIVVNMLGQPVYQESGTRSSGNQFIEMDVSNLADGVYYYTMIFENQKITSKMVIAK